MLPSVCGPMGFAGWLVVVVLWAGIMAAAVWGIAWLFPDRSDPADPATVGPAPPDEPSTPPRRDSATASSLADAVRH